MPTEIQIAPFTDQTFGENAYLLWRSQPGPCWIIDPGFPPTPTQMIRQIRSLQLTPELLILTHGHLDHIAGVPDILKAFPNLPTRIADEDKAALTDPNENLSSGYGFPVVVGNIPTADLRPGETLTLDGTTWQILDTSGHAPGGRSLYCPEAAIAIVGDALFAGSIGRTDFHHSDADRFLRNIRDHLLSLPPQTQVYSGHGPLTTIGEERRNNPFVGGGG